MLLASFGQVNASETAVLHQTQGWEAYLRQVNVDLVTSRAPAYLASVNHRQVELDGEKAVDTGFERACINESTDASDSRNRDWTGFRGDAEIRIEADIH
jgi:hypothetical protein